MSLTVLINQTKKRENKLMLQHDLLNLIKDNSQINSLFQYRANRAPFAVGLPAGLLAAAAASLFQQRAQSL